MAVAERHDVVRRFGCRRTKASNANAAYGLVADGSPRQAMQTVPTNTEAHRAAVSNALRLLDELSQIRSVAQVLAGGPVLIPLLLLIMCWLTLISAGLNLFAPQSGTARVTNALFALAAASAVFLILEMEHGFSGVIQVSESISARSA